MIATLLSIALTALASPDPGTEGPDVQSLQEVSYEIEARLDEDRQILEGRARLTYTNRASVALDTLYLHQHLNAFRPNSAWATRELEFGERRFQDLGPEEHAFERFLSVTVDGRTVQPLYPGAPDSTVAAIPLPEALQPGATTVVVMDWEARPATEPRRQARAGRQYDFAQWYPRIAVYEEERGWRHHPLLPQGEFYGEFGTYDVVLELAEDQIIGATGVPVSGDPGWAGVAVPGTGEIAYRRDYYGTPAAPDLGWLGAAPDAGMKRIHWRAEDVHHFAWSTSPDFVYEGEVVDDLAFHILYRREAAEEWGNRVALDRTIAAREFGDWLFGRYLYPQVTNLHRIESGGTEFPMLFMDGSASEGLIVHEMVHMYAHAILANNEWREAWLDEGLTSFATNWYWEIQGRPAEQVWIPQLRSVQQFERAGRAEPVGLTSADFTDFETYIQMAYRKPALVFRMLRWMVGEETMVRIFNHYYENNVLSHVEEADLRRSVNAVTGEDYDWFFDQWIHTTDTLDYGIASATTRRGADGRWHTRVEVLRLGAAWMPVDLRVADETVRLTSRDRRQVVEVVTRERPEEAVLDPEEMLLDIDPTNNRREVL